jgi:hypothetical protein
MSGFFYFHRGMIINDLFKDHLIGPLDVINVVKNISNMKWYLFQVVIKIFIVKTFV